MRKSLNTAQHEQKKTLIKEMVLRMAIAYGVPKKQLHDCLGCTRAVVNNWAYYQRIPYDYLEICSAKTGASMDWLLYGIEPACRLTDKDILLIRKSHETVLKDGVAYGFIAEQHNGAICRLVDKFTNDLREFSKIGGKISSYNDKNTGS